MLGGTHTQREYEYDECVCQCEHLSVSMHECLTLDASLLLPSALCD